MSWYVNKYGIVTILPEGIVADRRLLFWILNYLENEEY